MLTVVIKHDDQLHKLWAQTSPPAFHTAQTRISSESLHWNLSQGCSALLADFRHFSLCSCWILCLQLLPVTSQHCLQGCIHPVGRCKSTAWTSRTSKAPLKETWFWDNLHSRAFLLHGLEVDATKLQMYALQIDPNTNLSDCLSPSCYKIFFLGSDLILTQLSTGYLSDKQYLGWFHKSPTSENSAPLFKRIPWWKDHRKDFFFSLKPIYIPIDCKGIEHTAKCHKVEVRATLTWCASCPVQLVDLCQRGGTSFRERESKSAFAGPGSTFQVKYPNSVTWKATFTMLKQSFEEMCCIFLMWF